MTRLLIAALAVLIAVSGPVSALTPDEAASRAGDAQIVVLGEVHDNPRHHVAQARIVAALVPSAVVWEMLTPEQAARITQADLSDTVALGDLLEWDASGWPDFAMYAPIFAAAPGASMYGAALTRAAIRAHLETDPVAVFGPDAEIWGLRTPLPTEQLAARMSLQWEAHCRALPEETLAPMVDIQRARDAALARAAVEAHDATGGPVVIITGNGHARSDWGVPAYIAHVRPDLRVFSVGQTEAGAPMEGGFDIVLDAPAVDRPDPCAAFR